MLVIKWKSIVRAALLLVLILLGIAACDQDSPQPTPPLTRTSPTPGITPSPSILIPTAPASTPTSSEPVSCAPTRADGEGPFYKPNAPERSSVGTGHVLKGVVKSTKNCAPILGAKIEFWQVNLSGEYDDDHRATMYSDSMGAYTFESNFPPAYENRPPHIHVRVSAQGYHTLITQYYPKEGAAGIFDLVIAPDQR